MNSRTTEKYLYAILSGAMLTASFPPGRLEFLAWGALVPLLRSLDHSPAKQCFRLGLLSGFFHYLTLTYWMIVVLEHYGNIDLSLSLSILMLLCLYLSLYSAVFAWGASFFRNTSFEPLSLASLWVGLEYLRAKLLTGFPWCLLGHSQYKHPILIQLADVTGVYGVSFVLVLSSATLYIVFFRRAFKLSAYFKKEIPVALAIGVFLLAYGHYRLSVFKQDGRRVRVSIVQGNIDQSIKWNPAYQEKTIQTYTKLTRKASRLKPYLIVWPETSVPFFFQSNPEMASKVVKVSEESNCYLIFGSPAFLKKNGEMKYFNRAYLLSPEGSVLGYYDKVHLVPFGEYVPLKKFLPFVNKLVVAAGDFAPGEKIEPLKIPGLAAGVLICYEAIFPEISRKQTIKGAQVLVNLTNDAWYGMTSAPFQHFSMGVFRAVENRRPLIRAANTGFSGFISAEGRIVERGDLFTEETLTREIKLPKRSLTIYTRYGDFFAYLVLLITIINFFYRLCYLKIKNYLWRGAKIS